MEFDFRSTSFKRKFSSNLFACNMPLGCSKNNRENVPYEALEKEKKPGLKFNHG